MRIGAVPVAASSAGVRRVEAASTRSRWAIVLSRVLWGAACCVAAAHGAYTVFDVGQRRWDWLMSPWTPCVVFAACCAVSLARGLAGRGDRAVWCVLAIGLGSYALAQAFLAMGSAAPEPPSFPAERDLLAWVLYGSALVAIALLVRTQRSRARPDLWLDGVIGGLAVASIGVVVVFEVVIDPLASLAGSPGNVVYVLGDLLVLGFGMGSFAVLGWRPSPALVALLVGFVALSIDDTLFMSATVKGTFVPAGPLDSYWQFAILLIAASAAWSRPTRLQSRPVNPTGLIAYPFVLALAVVALTANQLLEPYNNLLAVALTVLTLLAIVVRFGLTFRAHLAMIEATERDAITDALTGLGNRRKLFRDAERMFGEATLDRPVLFAIFDLDGLKFYNDTYGHPAGDALLVRLGGELARAIGTAGTAYRLGGDEFCVLLPGDANQRARGLAAAAGALSEQGEPYTVGNCFGSVSVPTDADDLAEALRVADRLLYAAKNKRTTTPPRLGANARDGSAENMNQPSPITRMRSAG
jgi:diguanylate cyclase (GGDEF)-like protein